LYCHERANIRASRKWKGPLEKGAGHRCRIADLLSVLIPDAGQVSHVHQAKGERVVDNWAKHANVLVFLRRICL
jgi:hypothetical protein